MSFVSIQNAVPLAYISGEALLLGFFVVFILPALLVIMAFALSITAYIRRHPRRIVIVTASLLTTTALLCIFYPSFIYFETARGSELGVFLWAVPQMVLATALTMIAYERSSLYRRRVLLISALTTLLLIIVLVTLYLLLLLVGRLSYSDYYYWWFWILVAGMAVGVVTKIVARRRIKRMPRLANLA